MIKNKLHQAILKGDIEEVKVLSQDMHLLFQKDDLGLLPINLASYLGVYQAVSILKPFEDKFIKVIFPDEMIPRNLTTKEFEKIFGVQYLSSVKFSDYTHLKKVIHQCPKGMFHSWTLEAIKLGREFENELINGYCTDLQVEWIDNTMGFGLFASMDLEEDTYIGEYTGVVEDLCRFKSAETTFCVKYPSPFFSLSYRVVNSKNAGNLMRFVNHSDIPNVYVRLMILNKVVHTVFFSKFKIKKGSQLTVDYGKDYWQRRKEEIFS